MDPASEHYLSILQWLLADTPNLQGTAAAEVSSNSLPGAVTRSSSAGSIGSAQGATTVPTSASSTLLNPTQQSITNSFMSLTNRQGLYNSVMYGGYQQPRMPSVAQVTSAYQPAAVVHPDVKIKDLPFFDKLSELIKPSSLGGCAVPNATRGQESSYVFYLTPNQATEVASNREVGPGTKNEYPVQVQLRFCLLETSCDQEDIFPPGISVKINGKPATLPNPIPTNRPGVEAKRPPRPVNISPLVKLSPFVPNHITVSYTPDYSREFVLVVNLVRKLSAQDLLDRLKQKGVKNSDYTRGLIKDKFKESDGECEIATTSLRVSLLCPLGKMRMESPVRSTLCSHLQCFDASLYLQMNEKRPTWTCPVCDKNIPFNTLVIDGYFQEVLKSPNLGSSQHEVQLLEDGSWSIQAPVDKEKIEKASVKEKENNVVIEEILDDGDDDANSEKTDKEESKKKIIEIDLCDSDSDTEPAAKKPVTRSVSSNGTAPTNSTTLNNHNNNDKSPYPNTLDSSIIMLDSPSPPPSASPLEAVAPSATTTPQIRPPISYPQIIQGAGQNTNRPLVMQIRLPPGESRYHPY